jgi:hypothetical protein
LKKSILILILAFVGLHAFSQSDSNTAPSDSVGHVKRLPVKRIKHRVTVDSLRLKRHADSLLLLDSSIKKDSFLVARTDSTPKMASSDTAKVVHKARAVVKKPIDSFYLKLLDNPFFRTKAKPIFLVINERKRTSKDEMFYLVSGLLLFLAFIKLVFGRYFQNIFRLFFQPSFRQKQTREQLQQGNLPSLLLNLFFILSTAAYISFLLNYYHISNIGFWLLFTYSSIALVVLYTGKYIFLSFAGWVFNVKEATDAYIFAVYLINKILGVILIPFTLVIAFSQPEIINVSITASILLILLLFLYRYLVSYGPVRREVKVSPIHFFFYVLAFEITPLLLIYKTLVLYLNKSL